MKRGQLGEADWQGRSARLAFPSARPYSFGTLVAMRMSMVVKKSSFAIVLAAIVAAFGFGPQAAHAQSVPYWPGWSVGIGNFTAAPDSNASSAFSGLGGRGGFSSRYNFSDGWFIGSERGGLGLNGFGQAPAWSNLSSLSYEGMQLGYNFKSAPVSVYAGFDTLKYNPGIGAGLPGFDSTPGTIPGGYSAHVGVEFRPASNLTLSVGAGFTQRNDSDINAALLPGASPFAFGRR